MNMQKWIRGGVTAMVIGATGLCAWAAPALAQESAVSFSDSDFDRAAKLMTGSWQSAEAVPGPQGASQVVFSAAPVRVSDVPDAMYVELARPEAMDVPFRQAIMQFHKVGGKVRLRTMEFRRHAGEIIALRGLWAAPETFPADINAQDLITTMEIELAPEGTGFSGKSIHGYPTSVGGAVEMSSEMKIDSGVLKFADRGMGPDGSVVWGPGAGQMLEFRPTGAGVTTTRMSDGLVVINFDNPSIDNSHTAGGNDIVKVHYVGSLGNGHIFDTSYERGTPYQYAYDGSIIQGWKNAMADARKGMKRKLVVPGPLAYGDRGNPRAKIGPNATLYFDIEVLEILPQAAPAPTQDVAKPIENMNSEGGQQPVEKKFEIKPQ
jgi:hypothetical protein